jgi:tRNA G18 (ribose-2'-O)-methylase SpoU
MQPQRVESLDDERLAPYRNLKQTNLTRWSGRFIAEGKLVVERLLASRLRTVSVLLSERRLGLLRELAPGEEVDTLTIPEDLARELTGFNFHAGVMACGERPASLGFEGLPVGAGALFVACPRMTDPDNLGGLIRISRALGVSGLLLGEGCADPYSRRALRVSMGNAFDLPILECQNLRSDLLRLRERHGCTLTATVLADDAQPLEETRGRSPEVLLLGNESGGLDAESIALCDRRITIPMNGGTDSLNVVVAAGIVIHWVRRR